MKFLVSKILYRNVFSNGPWFNIGMVPGTGSLQITEPDSDNGRLRTYELEASLDRNVARVGEADIRLGLSLIVTYDNGLQAHIGTAELPAMLQLNFQDVLKLSCVWREIPDTAL